MRWLPADRPEVLMLTVVVPSALFSVALPDDCGAVEKSHHARRVNREPCRPGRETKGGYHCGGETHRLAGQRWVGRGDDQRARIGLADGLPARQGTGAT